MIIITAVLIILKQNGIQDIVLSFKKPSGLE